MHDKKKKKRQRSGQSEGKVNPEKCGVTQTSSSAEIGRERRKKEEGRFASAATAEASHYFLFSSIAREQILRRRKRMAMIRNTVNVIVIAYLSQRERERTYRHQVSLSLLIHSYVYFPGWQNNIR